MTADAIATGQMASQGDLNITSGVIALINLQAQIAEQERRAALGPFAAANQAELIDLIALRGHILGSIADYEEAERLADQLAERAPADGLSFITRSRARARFHRFQDATADLDLALHAGIDSIIVSAERAAILQAVGRYDEALTLCTAVVEQRPDVTSFGALATLHAERGEIDAAERAFAESRSRYRGVSPFPPAQVDFQRGHMWMTHGDLNRARGWLLEACRLLPCYAPASSHLAEVEAALGQTDIAVDRLRHLADCSDDPDYAATLARILREIGRGEEAATWRAAAEARYEELVSAHCEAFADHAASFLLETGADPSRALSLAQRNLEVRPTARAIKLHERAARACEEVGIPR